MTEATVGVLLALVVATAAQTTSTCTNTDPCELSCIGCANEELVHDPEDCHNYYMCLNQTPIPELPLTCPDGEHFNHTTHQCVPGDECEGCVSPSAVCHYQCQEGVGQFAAHGDQFDCSTFVLCDGSADSVTLTCPPETPYFDGVSCQTDKSRCCSCYPYCTLSDIGHLVYDPSDCAKYYICTDIGVPENFGTCPSGELFNPVSGQCSSLVPCSTPPSCYNTIRPDGCIYSYTCQEFGVEAKCTTSCTNEYYYCATSDIGHRVEPSTCPGDEVFNPESHYCVPVMDCPFSSSFISLNTTVKSRINLE